ncbi:MAG: hypothetical protein NTY84_03180 [Verrucomicrobia bacterium]|nr:hypothetical protein [Verrucomicrobiota bacterium]
MIDKIQSSPLRRGELQEYERRGAFTSIKATTTDPNASLAQGRPRRCLEVMALNPVLAEASAAGFLPQRELGKFQSSDRLSSLRRSGDELDWPEGNTENSL